MKKKRLWTKDTRVVMVNDGEIHVGLPSFPVFITPCKPKKVKK